MSQKGMRTASSRYGGRAFLAKNGIGAGASGSSVSNPERSPLTMYHHLWGGVLFISAVRAPNSHSNPGGIYTLPPSERISASAALITAAVGCRLQ
jgi:hypothetical protein